MSITQLPAGDHLYKDEKAVIIKLKGRRKILSTSFLNGGYRLDLKNLFNYCEVYGRPDDRCEMRAPTYREHLQIIAHELGLDPSISAGLSTSAKMKYAAIKTASCENFSVTSIVTAGIDVNSARAGDPATWQEESGQEIIARPGTINIILHINANLSDEAITRAMVTCTEAKCAALQELLAPSCYSTGLATGSGTDGTIIIANMESKTLFTDAGHHTKLGESIGRVVTGAVKDALVAENGFKAYACGNLIKRVKRYGITEESLWRSVKATSPYTGNSNAIAMFSDGMIALNKNEQVITLATLFIHLLDLLQWRLVETADAVETGFDLLTSIAQKLNLAAPDLPVQTDCNEEAANHLLAGLHQILVSYLTEPK